MRNGWEVEISRLLRSMLRSRHGFGECSRVVDLEISICKARYVAAVYLTGICENKK
jgi:hypothetical protein